MIREINDVIYSVSVAHELEKKKKKKNSELSQQESHLGLPDFQLTHHARNLPSHSNSLL